MKTPFKLKIPVGWVRGCYTIGASLFWAVPNDGLHAQEFTYTNINGAVTITRYNGPGGDVTIPSAIDGLPVVALGDWAIGYVTNWTVTSVTIPNSVVKLGAYAVSGCEALTNVTIGASVARIGDSAFSGCISLPAVLLPASLTNLGQAVFSGCGALSAIQVDSSNPYYSSRDGVLLDKSQTTLIAYPAGKGASYIIPTGVMEVGAGAFGGCNHLNSVYIPDTVTNIADYAFYEAGLTNLSIPGTVSNIGNWALAYCPLSNVQLGTGIVTIGDTAFTSCRLTSLVIPDSVKFIGGYAFNESYTLTNLVIGNQVLSIGPGAFEGGLMTSVTIPASVTNIGLAAFDFCNNLQQIIVAPLNSSYSSVDGLLFSKAQDTLVRWPAGKTGTYTVPQGVTTIEAGAFLGCSGLTNVIMPNSLTYIGNVAFYESYNLKGLYFKGNPPNLGQTALGDDSLVTVYYLPGTAGWGSTFGGLVTKPWVLPNPVILSPGLQANEFGFIISWATNLPVVVEASTNLLNPGWQPLQTNALISGSFYFSDPQWKSYPKRFYRARSP